MPRRAIPPLLAVLLLAVPRPASAQLGAVEAFLRNVTDVSFYGGMGRLAPQRSDLTTRDPGYASYGVEMLFSIGTIQKTLASTPAEDSVTLQWTTMEVHAGSAGVDTVYHYDVAPTTPTLTQRTIWLLELGIGYGQTSGFRLTDPAYRMRGVVRDLPSVSVYATYENTDTYFGLRSGFMKTQALQVVGPTGDEWAGEAEAFLLGAVIGQAKEVLGIDLFAELGYTLRYFPSVRWSGSTPEPAALPLDLNLSGFTLNVGLQFGIKQ